MKGKLYQAWRALVWRALYHGWKIRVEVVDYKGISIDTEQDLERAKGIYLKGN